MFVPCLMKIPKVSRACSVPGYPRVLPSTRATVPRCAVQIRGPYSPEIARSKMGYPPGKMPHTRGFRGGLGRFPDIARPTDHRFTSDRCSSLRKSLLLHDIEQFSSSHFSRKWKLLRESVEMSGMILRIEWKCSRVSAGPPSGRNPLVKCGLDKSAPFFRV